MRLISLAISNFRVIKDVRLSFPDSVIGVIGPNGAGKSSLIEAISWALYGNQAARTGKDEIKSSFATPDESCEVNLEFSVNEQHFRVIRRLVGRSERAEVELYRGESSESVGVNETRAYVGELLGLDWRGFLSSFMARQAELNALSDLQPSKRRDHIAGMLGIERLDKAIQKVKEDSRLNLDKGDFLQRQLAEKEHVEKSVAQLRESVAQMTSPVETFKQQVSEAEKDYGEAKAAYEILKQKREEWLRIHAEVAVQLKTGENLSEQLEGLKTEREQLGRDLVEVDGLGRDLEALKPLQSELEKLKEIKGRAVLAEQLKKRQTEVADQLARDEKELAGIEKRLGDIDGRFRDLPQDLEQQFARKQKDLDTARDEYSRLRAEVDALKAGAERLENQLKDIASLGPDSVCERCRRPFGEDYDEIKGHMDKELEDMRGRLVAQERLLDEKKLSGETLRKEVIELERRKTERHELTVEQRAASRERQSVRERIEAGRSAATDTKQQLETLGPLEYDEAQLKRVADRMTELEKTRQRHDQLRGGLKRLPAVEKALADVEGKIKSSKEMLSEYNRQLAEVGFDEKPFKKCSEQFNDTQLRLESVRQEYLARAKEKELAEKELEGKLEQLRGFEAVEMELEQTRSAHYYGEKLGRLFGEFRQHLIASIRPSLAEISSRLLSEMTDGKYGLVELDEKYNLRLMDGGAYYGVDRFSGGEKDLANLCLRLAISLALTESAGLARSFVILDEVFGSQDDQRKELILKAMGRLKQRFPQILLITHVDDIREGVEEIIEVAPTGNGWSVVKVNGSTI